MDGGGEDQLCPPASGGLLSYPCPCPCYNTSFARCTYGWGHRQHREAKPQLINESVYMSDKQVECVIVQRFGPEWVLSFTDPSQRVSLLADSSRNLVALTNLSARIASPPVGAKYQADGTRDSFGC